MISIVGSAIAGTVLTILLITVFIFAVLDPSLPIYWKIIVGIISVILTYGSISTLRDYLNRVKTTYANKEDLR